MNADILLRIAQALERLAPEPVPAPDMAGAGAFIWTGDALRAATRISRVDLALLQGIDRQKTILLANTRRFAAGLPANNALLWGARGMGKSSLVKAVHAACPPLALVEINREDIESLPTLLDLLASARRRFLLFCDDLSFDSGDARYKALKAVLEGGIEGRPANVLFYATSNRRHMIPRDLVENEQREAINPADVVDDKLSLSDRFGLWLGFHACSQDEYLAMIDGYIGHYGLVADRAQVRAQALEWAVTRGARSGRVAFQFILDLAGRLGQPLV